MRDRLFVRHVNLDLRGMAQANLGAVGLLVNFGNLVSQRVQAHECLAGMRSIGEVALDIDLRRAVQRLGGDFNNRHLASPPACPGVVPEHIGARQRAPVNTGIGELVGGRRHVRIATKVRGHDRDHHRVRSRLRCPGRRS